jgi:hypothetical protein
VVIIRVGTVLQREKDRFCSIGVVGVLYHSPSLLQRVGWRDWGRRRACFTGGGLISWTVCFLFHPLQCPLAVVSW